MKREPYRRNKGKKCSIKACQKPAYSKGRCRGCCNRIYLRSYQKRNPERMKEYRKKYRATEQGKIKEAAYNKKYRENNRAKIARRQRERTYEKKFGLTKKEVRALRRKHQGRCAICAHKKPLCLDHCHLSGKPRGFLCITCNTGLAFVERGPDLVKKAQKYLALYQ